MADHIGISKINHDDIEGAVFNSFDHRVGDAGGAHFWFQIVSRDFLRWHNCALFTWKRLLPFFQLPDTITHHAQMVQVELRPFSDRALNRSLPADRRSQRGGDHR